MQQAEVLQLLNIISQPANNQSLKQASQQLQATLNHPSTIPLLLTIASQDTNISVQ
jgi:hypothetical protein